MNTSAPAHPLPARPNSRATATLPGAWFVITSPAASPAPAATTVIETYGAGWYVGHAVQPVRQGASDGSNGRRRFRRILGYRRDWHWVLMSRWDRRSRVGCGRVGRHRITDGGGRVGDDRHGRVRGGRVGRDGLDDVSGDRHLVDWKVARWHHFDRVDRRRVGRDGLDDVSGDRHLLDRRVARWHHIDRVDRRRVGRDGLDDVSGDRHLVGRRIARWHHIDRVDRRRVGRERAR